MGARPRRVTVAAVKRSVTVQIAGLRYSLKSDDDDRTIKALAAYVDAKIRDIQKHAKVPDTQAVAVLTALQIAEELFTERREASELRKRIREKGQSLLDYLEREARL
jgi:cell division protein ZapA